MTARVWTPALLALLLVLACRAGEEQGGEQAAVTPAAADGSERAEPEVVAEPEPEPTPDSTSGSTPGSTAGPVAAAEPDHPFSAEELAVIFSLSPPPPPPPDPTNAVADDPAAAQLGQFLFFERRLSGTGTISCATCHDPGRGWADGQRLATGVARLTRHAQSLWNVAHNRWFFWDGRADSLWSQALIPLEDPREHAGSRLQYAHLVHDDSELRPAYEAVFGSLPELSDGRRFPPAGRPVPGEPEHPHQRAWSSMTAEDQEAANRVFVNLGKALAAFQRRILSDSTPFDWYVGSLRIPGAPRPRVFTRSAERGLGLFIGKAGCRSCHHGPLFTDLEFHNTRLPYGTGGERRDPGRYRGIPELLASPFLGNGAYSDEPGGEAELKVGYLAPKGHEWGEFKTPGLRNVAATAPYMHQGQFQTLEEVVRFYSTLEGAQPAPHPDPLLQPLHLDEQELADLVAFLASLTNPALPVELMVQPASPVLAD